MTNTVQLVESGNPILKTELPRFDFSNPPINPVELYNQVGKALIAYNGLGLAANQLGYPYRMFVIKSDPIQGFFNPIIVDQSDEQIEMEEGCLSYPGLILKIKRPQVIKVRYADPTGVVQTKKYQDLTARIIQHEIDHLNGVVFGSKVSRLQLERAIKKSNKNYIIGDLI